MRGRKPKPTVLKLLSGNPGHRPLNQHEPAPPGELLDPPEWMSETQKESWRYALSCAPKGLLRRLDRSLLAVWVVAEDTHREATIKMTQTGMLVKAPNTGLPIQSPYLPIMNRQAQIMLKAASELGFTPTSRSRITLQNSEAPTNRFAAYRKADSGNAA